MTRSQDSFIRTVHWSDCSSWTECYFDFYI